MKNDVTVHMHTKSAVANIQAGKNEEATKKIDEAKSILNSNILVWESSLQQNLDEVIKSQQLQVVSISRDDNTTITVKLNKAVSTIVSSEFTFDNSLTVTCATLSDDGTTVILSTSVHIPGMKYVLNYKESNISFTAPGSLIPIQIADKTTQQKDTTEVIAITANFTQTYNDPTKKLLK